MIPVVRTWRFHCWGPKKKKKKEIGLIERELGCLKHIWRTLKVKLYLT